MPLTTLTDEAGDIIDVYEALRPINSYGHLRTRKATKEGKTRNPKDEAVSFYNHHYSLTGFYHYNGSWANYLPRFNEGNVDYGSYLDYAEVWEKFRKDHPDYPIHLMYYEDMMKDGVEEWMKLSKFLGMNTDPLCIAKMSKLCGFDNLKKEKEKLIPLEFCRDKKPTGYRKGKVGDWKNWFTVAQNMLFDKKITEKNKNLNFKMIFEI